MFLMGVFFPQVSDSEDEIGIEKVENDEIDK